MWGSIVIQAGKLQTASGGFFPHLDRLLVFWTFLAIGVAASLFVIITLMLGELGDLFGADHDFDHGSDLSHDVAHDHDFHAELGAGAESMAGLTAPHLFSFRIIITFVAGFGLIGAVSTWAGASVIMSSVYGLIAGMIMAGLMYAFVHYLATQQASVNVSDSDLIGKEAQVVVKIPADSVGQVQFNTTSGTMTKIAMSTDHTEIPEGSVVKIERITGQTAFVKKLADK
jgi:membrane protein implicated in regulation of membrane protease activity